ncbi:phosphate transporter, partial [Nowakowskiella sp. JEL0078]
MADKKAIFASLDDAKFSKAHIRAILVAGSGFLTDSYDNFVIGLVVPMIAYTYYGKGSLPNSTIDGVVKAMSSIGNLVGQLGFGVMGDIFGRKRMYGIELIILIIGAVGSALSAPPAAGVDILAVLGFWRFILGIGVGGDYPVSAVITSEFASSKRRGTMIAIVFAMQGVGILLASIVAVILVAAFQPLIIADKKNLDYVWRILLGFGAVPALAAVYYRLTIPETPRFSNDVLEDAERAQNDGAVFLSSEAPGDHAGSKKDTITAKKFFGDFAVYFGKWANLKVLIGTSLTWFFLDIGYYGTNLNTSLVLGYIGYTDPSSPYNDIWAKSTGNAIIALCGLVPGFFFTIGLVDVWGRKPIQFMGFGFLTAIFLALAVAYNELKNNSKVGFVILYSFAQFFFNFGPNTTTFIIPAECFPTKVRSSAHGISAGTGKLGAIIAALGFAPLAAGSLGVQGCLYIFTGCMALGGLFTFWVPETKGFSLEELSEKYDNDGAYTAVEETEQLKAQ